MGLGHFGGQFPFRIGGGESLARRLYRDLNGMLGTAYDISEPSPVTAETSAEARLIAASWHANERAANQLDSDRVTDFLERWETILELKRSHGDTPTIRRNRVKAKRSATGSPTRNAIETLCANALGTMFVQVEYTPLSSAVQRWPGNGFPDGWYSTTAHVVVRVMQPVDVSETLLVSACNSLMAMLRDFMPDWTTVTWAMFNSNAVEGFILDDLNNLDTETFGP